MTETIGTSRISLDGAIASTAILSALTNTCGEASWADVQAEIAKSMRSALYTNSVPEGLPLKVKFSDIEGEA